MKFLSSTEYLYPEKGGGEYALRNLLLELENQGHETVAFHNGETDPEIKDYTASIPNIPGGWSRNFLQSLYWKRKLPQMIEEEDPDYVITQLGLAPVTQEICDKKDVECIILLIDYSHLCISRFAGQELEKHSCLKESQLKFKWQWPIYHRIKKKYKRAIENAEHVFSNSNFMQEITQDFLGLETDVLYPPVDLESAYTEETGDKIGMINPSKHKGGKILAEIAKKLDEEFLVRGRPKDGELKEKLEGLENIEFIGHVDEMKDFYSQIKLLLVTSQWPEPFGMVVPEAMYSQKPALVSKTGGLKEATKFEELQIKEFKDSGEWIERINDISMNEAKEYRQQAKSFGSDNITRKLIERIS